MAQQEQHLLQQQQQQTEILHRLKAVEVEQALSETGVAAESNQNVG